jgi:hypothetical protein
MKALKTARNVLGTAGLLFAGYLLINALPEFRRYLRIRTMNSRIRLVMCYHP